ncbi:MAG: type II toxin-antitoxin system RelE/ParE family toxin [Clostridiales bacterium]|jgi:plasmid stabilization system protein ParE|nr:type II toxin-antitoxin system RelE/ParE family toxin [Clostridiales bacterium]
MYRLRYLPLADLDMEEAEAYWNEHHPPAAATLADALVQKTDGLINNPFIYKVYEERPYFRCMPLPFGYLCFYHVDEYEKIISVHRILRGMRDISKIL